MSVWTNGTYTRKGLALLAKLTQGSTLKITKAVAGTGHVSPELLADQTAVTGAKQELFFKAASYPKAGTCKLPMFISNEGLAAGYTARQIGLYANDPDAGEILYFIAQSANGTDVPSAAEMPDYSATWTFYFSYGQAAEVDVTVDPSHTITEDMLAEVRAIAEAGVSVAHEAEVIRKDNTAALPFASLRLFGKTTQDGTPTPDSPVSLVSAGEGAPIYANVHSKNLLNVSLESGTHSGMTVTVHDDGRIDVSGTSTGGGIYLQKNLLLGKGIYTLSVGSDLNLPSGNGIWVYGGDGAVQAFLRSGSKFTFEAKKLTSVNVYLFHTKDAEWNISIYPQLEVGSVPTAYEKGKAVQLAATAIGTGLCGVPVASNGNYTDVNGQQWVCDEIDFARGVYIQRVFAEERAFSYDEINSRYSATLTHEANANCGTATSIPVLCNLLEYNPSAGVGNPSVNGIRGAATSPKYVIAYYNGEAIGTATVMYPLATPIETALSAEELALYAAVVANNPTTTIISNAAWMEADLIEAQHERAFRMFLKRLEALEAANVSE